MSIFEHIIFIGYTPANPVFTLMLLISVCGILGEIYLQFLLLKPSLRVSLPQNLVVVFVGLIQALMIPLIAQHTLTFHQQLIWTFIGLFFAISFHIDTLYTKQKLKSSLLNKVFSAICIGMYGGVTLSLFLYPVSFLGAIIPALLWLTPFIVWTKKGDKNQSEQLRRYLRLVWVSGIGLGIWTFFTV